MGHLTRCLAYARRLSGMAQPIFFSQASAIEIIQSMGFDADYFVSRELSASHINAWNRELAIRFGLMLEEVTPEVVVFDGTWPYHGFMDACDAFGVKRRVWSNRRLHKAGFHGVPVSETAFDLVIEPGEVGSRFEVLREGPESRKVAIPPVSLLQRSELLDRSTARRELGLRGDARYILFSMGAGNLNDVDNISLELIREIRSLGFEVVWAQAPISYRDLPTPAGVTPIMRYPLFRFIRAFDAFVGAAGYNTCCEVLLSGTPSLLVPNEDSWDDQPRRAGMLAESGPVVASSCKSRDELLHAVAKLSELADRGAAEFSFEPDGARIAAVEILALAQRQAGT